MKHLIITLTMVLLLAGCAERGEFDAAAYQPGEPQYGGTLNVGTFVITLSALSWDPSDWTWKSAHDTGMVREELFVGDLQKSVRNGGPYRFIADAYLPEDAIRGELAESWEWEDPLTLAVKLREGIMITGKPGVMESRPIVADDIVFTYELLNSSPKKIPTYFDHIDRVEALDDHTVVFYFNEYNAEWMYRFGYGYFSSITPRETANVDRKDWRNVVGTGPFELTEYLHANSHTYTRNPNYWDTASVNGVGYQIPFVDETVYRIIKDEATYLTALRTGKLDILEAIRWINVDHLKETSPELQWSRWLGTAGMFMVLRVDREPLDDVRVRRALNLAVDQPEIASEFYGGHAELMAFPQHPGFGDYFQPLSEMPDSVKELYTYNPEKARQLLAEAGYPEGFDLDVQVCSCSSDHMDLIPLLEDYLGRVGVRLNIQPMEYASFLSAMTTRTHAPGYMMNKGHANPTTTMRSTFVTGQTWNPSMYSDASFDARMAEVFRTRDEAERMRIVRGMTIDILNAAPHIWLPTPYVHTAWWPWVRNYDGELRVGAARPGPIYARIWIDQALKRELGF